MNKENGQVHVLVESNESNETNTTNIFTWKNVRNSVPIGSGKKATNKILLDGISGNLENEA
jgi:hypothetical protein